MSSFRLYLYQRTSNFRNDWGPMCRNIQSTVYWRSPAAGLFERLRLQDVDVVMSKKKIAFGRMRVWDGCDKVVDVCLAGEWGTRAYYIGYSVFVYSVSMSLDTDNAERPKPATWQFVVGTGWYG